MAGDQIKKVAQGIFNMIAFINYVLSMRYFAMQRKALSIRDILNMTDFIKVSLHLLNGDPVQAFRHAVSLVIVDGLCLGVDVAGDKQKKEIMGTCIGYLNKLIEELFGSKQEQGQPEQYLHS